MVQKLKDNLGFIFLAAIFGVTMYFAVTISKAMSEDSTVYLSQDTYREMSVAKIFSEGKGWGVSGSVKTPVNSILYPVMLGGFYKVFGVREPIPLVLNIAAGSFAIWLIWFFFRKEKMWQISAMTTGFFIFLSSSMPLLIMQGNENTLLIAVAVVLIYFSSEKGSGPAVLAVFSFCLGAISPEGLPVAIGAATVLALKKEFRSSIIVLISAAAAPAAGMIFGLWNGYEVFAFLKPEKTAATLMQKEYLFPVIALAVTAAAAWRGKGYNSKYASISLLALTAVLIKIFFMKSALSPDSVLFSSAISIFAVSIAGFGMFPDKPERNLKTGMILTSCFMLYLVFLYPMVKRGFDSYLEIPGMSRNAYERSYRLGLFVRECCDKKGVVSDDTGAMTYLADIDFIGIGKAAPPDFREENLAAAIKVKKAVISIASDKVTERYIKYFPQGSAKLREWVIDMPGNKKESLVFYCLDPAAYGYLRAKLNNFSAYLPPDIKIK
jgi:hypothetical protein